MMHIEHFDIEMPLTQPSRKPRTYRSNWFITYRAPRMKPVVHRTFASRWYAIGTPPSNSSEGARRDMIDEWNDTYSFKAIPSHFFDIDEIGISISAPGATITYLQNIIRVVQPACYGNERIAWLTGIPITIVAMRPPMVALSNSRHWRRAAATELSSCAVHKLCFRRHAVL